MEAVVTVKADIAENSATRHLSFAFPCGRHHLANGAGSRDSRAHVFHLAGAWRGIYVVGAALALYLDVFRRGGAGVPESTGPKGAGPDAERAAGPGCSTRCHGTIYPPGHFRGEEVPRGAGR